jgi:signal transduction histidine kinase
MPISRLRFSDDEGTSVMQALHTAGAAALCVGADGAILEATASVSKVLGRSSDSLVAQTLDSVFSFTPHAAEALEVARRDGAQQSILADGPDGSTRVVIDWLSGPEPRSGYALLSGAECESASTENLRFQTQLVSLVAHDVRDSLAAVYVGLHALADALDEGDPLQDTVALALKESERANRITRDVLNISRPGDLVRVDLDIDTVVVETLARFRARAAARSIEVIEKVSSGSRILADLSSIERVLSNLIENALDATPPQGRLTVTCQREERGAAGVGISVRDTGLGIKEETRPNVFEPFVTNKSGGTGLGLAIARRVILDHNGQIDFETQEGEGTTFHIWLPRSHFE